jgi:hypothetical protein
MANVLPGSLFPNYQLLASGADAPSDGVFIPLATLVGLTSAEANASTGDGRKVAYELTRALYNNFSNLADSAKPTHFIADIAPPVGLTPDIVRRTYTLSFDLDITGSDVTTET